MNAPNSDRSLRGLAESTREIPYTHPLACQLIYAITCAYEQPQVLEVACGYGKASVYLASAAAARDGRFKGVDAGTPRWKGLTVIDRLSALGLENICDVSLGCDARWYLLDLFEAHQGLWIDVGYVDASHTVEVDSFIALAMWTHLAPGGTLIFDDLDWTASEHGSGECEYSRPTQSHVRRIYTYMSLLPGVAACEEWGRHEVEWSWGFLQKEGVARPNLPALFAAFDAGDMSA